MLTLREALEQIIREGHGERLMSDGAEDWDAYNLRETLAGDVEALSQPVSYDGQTIRRVNEDTTISRGEPLYRVVDARPRKPGRPRLYDGPREWVRVQLPADLIAEMDAASDNRTSLIERATRAYLSQGQPAPE